MSSKLKANHSFIPRKRIIKNKTESEYISKRNKMRIASIDTSYQVPKNLEMRFAYRMPGDIYIDDHLPCSNKSIGLLVDFKKYKKILTVIHEKNTQIIKCQLMDNCNFFPPVQLLIYRLQSLGDANAYSLCKTVQMISEFKNSLQNMKKTSSIKEIQERSSYKNFLKNNENLEKELSEKYPIIFWKGSNFENLSVHRVFEIGFNHKIIKILGESIHNFAFKLMKKGIPNFLFTEGDYFQTFNGILKNVFFPKESEENLSIFLKSFNKKIRSRMITMTNKFNEDNFSEVFLIEVFEINKLDLGRIDLNLENNYKSMPDNIILNKMEEMNVIVENNAFFDGNTKWIKIDLNFLNKNFLKFFYFFFKKKKDKIKNNFMRDNTCYFKFKTLHIANFIIM